MLDQDKIQFLMDNQILIGAKPITVDGELMCNCPFHSESNPSFGINLNTGQFNCFACDERGSSFMSFFKKINEYYGIEFKDDIKSKTQSINHYIQNLKLPTKINTPKIIMSEKVLEQYVDPIGDYMNQRIKNKKIQKMFEIKYCEKINKYLIPIKNRQNELVGYVIRQFKEPKYLYNKGFEKKQSLFGINHIDTKINVGILTEGSLDVIKAYDNGYKNVVGILGAKMSEEQENLILRYFNNLVIATDNDKVGLKCMEDCYKRLHKKIKIKCFSWVTGKKDLGELSKEEMQLEIANLKKAPF